MLLLWGVQKIQGKLFFDFFIFSQNIRPKTPILAENRQNGAKSVRTYMTAYLKNCSNDFSETWHEVGT
jgi:hypothetical protein